MTYKAIKCITTNLQKTCDQSRIQLWVGSLASEIYKFHNRFFMAKISRGACWFQCQVGLIHCEYSGITSDLLVSNIGGTYDLADQLPSNREFAHFLVVSQSHGFGVKNNIARGIQYLALLSKVSNNAIILHCYTIIMRSCCISKANNLCFSVCYPCNNCCDCVHTHTHISIVVCNVIPVCENQTLELEADKWYPPSKP